MRSTVSIRALVLFLGGLTIAGLTSADDSIPGSDRSSAWRLSYRIPQNWVSDPEMAEKLNLTALLVPEGETFQSADRIITVAYQEKRPGLPIPSTLRQFFDSEMSQLVRMFPDLDSEPWHPLSMEKTCTETREAPRATPSRGVVWPSAMPATWVPWKQPVS